MIDEDDNIASKSDNRSITLDVFGEGVQLALWKILSVIVVN